MRRISWRAFSMPSLVPVMRMLALESSGRGIAILVAVFSSSSCSFSPFLPMTNRWCSLGMATVAEACGGIRENEGASHNLLASLHDGVQFARDHDGQTLVFSQGQLDVSPRPLHDVQAHFGLLTLPKLAVVLVATLLQGYVEHLGRGSGCLTWVMTEALMGLILLPHAEVGSPAFSPGAPFSGSGGRPPGDDGMVTLTFALQA
ncbi:hypothetical protein INR49_011873 [Caranx melampygus]|nr:hypothetical protein INR49_011873 [Caranx melampygus]